MKLFFFLNEEIHKKLVEIPSENVIVAWNFPQEKRMWYDRSFVKREYGHAYNIKEVADLLNESINSIKLFLERGILDRPFKIYHIESRKALKYLWSEKEVLAARDRLYDLAPKNKYNEPHKKLKLISKGELLAKMRDDNAYYVRDEDGQFIKIWKNI